jgi:hypothetical protein
MCTNTFVVLRRSGELHIADFGQPHTGWGRLVAPLIRRFEPISDNLDGLLPVLFQDAGFVNIADVKDAIRSFTASPSLLPGGLLQPGSGRLVSE